MGHEIVTFRNRAAIIQDDEFEAIRHFLLIEAQASRQSNLAALAVFREARSLLGRSGNDFAWSSWEGPEAALSVIDAIVAALERGKTPDLLEMRVLFAATGPIQEVSLSSGWAQTFLDLAARFDVALQSL